MTKPRLFAALAVGTLLVAACSDSDHPGGAPVGTAGRSGAGSGGTSTSGSGGGSAGELVGGSESGSTVGGEGGAGGGAPGGSGGASVGGTGNPPEPPVGDPPICPPGATFATGSPLAISGAGDELLQAITPDETTIAWRSGDEFFVADRSGVEFPFDTPMLVPGSSDLQAVTLSADGLRLIGVGKDRRVIEMVRQSTLPFDDEHLSEGDFELFNAAIASDPTPGLVLLDAVVSTDAESFFYSYFLDGGVGSGPTLYESGRSGGFWTLASADLGALLYRSEGQRRVPTGLSSDSLSLFYRDEVEGDFRVAWRVNTQVPFDHVEVLDIDADVEAAAPNRQCTRIYYSAPGEQGLDIFTSDRIAP